MEGNYNLKGKTALVTGASRGLGEQMARTLHRAGASVILVARTDMKDLAHELNEKMYADNDQVAISHPCFLMTDAETLAQGVAQYDVPPVSILVNNAGIGHRDRAVDCPPQIFQMVNSLNLRVPVELSQSFAKRWIASGSGGSIINIASMFGLTVNKGMIAYAISKAALIQATKAMALEWGGHGIRVNALCPGWHMTDMTRRYLESSRGSDIAGDIPLGRFGEPSDLDGPLMLLASDAGRYITGTTLVVDGGLSISCKDG